MSDSYVDGPQQPTPQQQSADTPPPAEQPAAGTSPSVAPGSRLLVGISVATLVIALATLAGVGVVVLRLWSASAGESGRATIASSPPASFSVGSNGTATLRGWANGMGSSDGGTTDAPDSRVVGSFGVSLPTQVNGVSAAFDVSVSVTRDTTLTQDGKPFSPSGSSSMTPLVRLLESEFGESEPPVNEQGIPALEQHQLVIKAHVVNGTLIADSVDIDKSTPPAPDPIL